MVRLRPGVCLSVQEAAVRAGVDPATVRRWLRLGILPGTRRGLRAWMIPPAALDALLSGAGATPTAAAGQRPTAGDSGALACPVKGCATSWSSAVALVAHLTAAHGPGLPSRGRPPRATPPRRCRRRGCRVIVDTRRGGGRGLCAGHYRQARRAELAVSASRTPRRAPGVRNPRTSRERQAADAARRTVGAALRALGWSAGRRRR